MRNSNHTKMPLVNQIWALIQLKLLFTYSTGRIGMQWCWTNIVSNSSGVKISFDLFVCLLHRIKCIRHAKWQRSAWKWNRFIFYCSKICHSMNFNRSHYIGLQPIQTNTFNSNKCICRVYTILNLCPKPNRWKDIQHTHFQLTANIFSFTSVNWFPFDECQKFK